MSKKRSAIPPPPENTLAPSLIPPTKPEPAGLACPKCGCHHFEVERTKPMVGRIMRRRVCRHCGRKVTTYEKLQGAA